MSTNTTLNFTFSDRLTLLEHQIVIGNAGADTIWIAVCTFLIFIMQTGFALIEAGSTRYKNYNVTVIRNVLDICTSTIFWWLWGYAFAFGETRGRIIGTTFFAGDKLETTTQFNNWFFQWAFAGSAATIVSAGALERISIFGYAIFSSFMVSWIYPLIVHWCWNPEGWLKNMGYHDFSGSGVVQMVGGAGSLAATIIIGARKGRYSEKNKNNDEFRGTFYPFIALGTLILWFGWYGFNCGSTFTIIGKDKYVGKIGMNTSISAAAGGLAMFISHYFINKGKNDMYSLPNLCNGIIAGLVAITAGCDAVSSWGAFIIGFISIPIFWGYNYLFRWLKLDDPLEAASLHMGTGSWGVISVGWFHTEHGILYNKGGRQFGVQLLGAVVIFCWSFTLSSICLLIIKWFGILRIPESEEDTGSDVVCCGGFADHYDEYTRYRLSKNFDKNSYLNFEEPNNICITDREKAIELQFKKEYNQTQLPSDLKDFRCPSNINCDKELLRSVVLEYINNMKDNELWKTKNNQNTGLINNNIDNNENHNNTNNKVEIEVKNDELNKVKENDKDKESKTN